MSLIKNSTEYKSSDNEQENLVITSDINNIWSKEDMVASTQNNNNNTSSNTEYTDLSQLGSLIYSPTLSSSSQDLENGLSTDESIIAIAQNNDLFLQEYINVEELQKYANDKILCSLSTTPTTPSTTSSTTPSAPSVTPVKPIKPALPLKSTVSTPNSENDNSDPSINDESNPKKKAAGGRKRKAESLEEKEQRQRERILRNRHAAQMSRDKKRRQMADLESQNLLLKEENEHLSKRLKVVEEENINLSAKLDVISAQLNEIQSHLAVSEMTKVLLDGVRGSAVSATLDYDSIASKNNNGITYPIMMMQKIFWTMTGQKKNFQLLGKQMVFVDDIVILELDRLLKERRSKPVKALRGNTISGMKRVPRDWRKYPP
ncbi:bZIP transcription factor HacA [Rhizophagus clarus]|uniref:BZIP transcription factor HacA n=1 Tax=Rhizophagus clarus TaxID=94130 RepID=A0A8H3M5K1_9GLOM|nr:bZIP transcription factor HacA [Rhizophagus clarus]